jgi:Putative MetA-pathway of phenol degradation
MKNILTTTIALLALTVAAHATDLPSKAKAPAAPVAAATTESTDSLSISYAEDTQPNLGDKKDDSYTVSYTHKLNGGFTVGGFINPVQYLDNSFKMNAEAQVGYSLPAFAGVTLGTKLGLGERMTSPTNFPYYAIYGTADYKVMDKLTWNAVSYRYRNAVDTTNNYESHQLGTGVTYDITSNYSVNAKVYRQWDGQGNNTNDGVGVGLTVKF